MQNVNSGSKKACLISLGCKVNKYEIECMANILKNNGWQVSLKQEVADLYVVNTCAVTNEGEKKSRQYIAKLIKLNPNAKIVVCGCASQNNLEQFKKANVVSIIGNEGKEHILDLIENSQIKRFDFPTEFNEKLANPIKSKTRAYIKVQDGCNNFCSYCLIPYVRGRSRSRNFDSVIKEATLLSKQSAEIVVTGIDLSSYKVNGELYLGELIYALKDLPCRIRLGSLEVGVVTEPFLKLLSNTKNFCPHFHLSLQSGCNSTLVRMNRHYKTNEYLEKVELIRKYFPTANITTDVIVGFLGETDDEFNETKQTCKLAKFGAMHIFPYSKREGTVASKLTIPAPSSDVVKNRVSELNQIKDELSLSFYNSLKGLTFNMLVEEKEEDYFVGFTENYVKVYVSEDLTENQIVKVEMLEPFKQGMKAKVIK